MLIGKETVKNLKPGSVLTLHCKDLPEYNSSYQTAWQARIDMGLDKEDLKINRNSKELVVRIERIRKEKATCSD